ncbi:hypothetical protein PRIPAC_86335, partial [Pristionchus pacificus]|uniref:Uncharacterized protein n=1 Tax=Pristionchus pacificus TaxID=54126 RepID=A0A2A6BLE4_PRIPA
MSRLNHAEIDLIIARLLQIRNKSEQFPSNVVKVSDASGNARMEDKTEYLRRRQEADDKCAKEGCRFSLSCGGCGSENRPSVFSTACGHEKKIEKTENIPTVPIPLKSKFILTRIASR